ncbi:MAG: SMC-Scp complex subunit ScpB [Acidobacteriales bacterium]|nr:SMC-Scp complex subunit ScpB [Terriglobales bacterium]
MSLKAKIEAIIYAAEEPISLDEIGLALKEAGLYDELMPSSGSTASPAAPSDDPKAAARAERNAVRACLRPILEALVADYQSEERGMEIRQVANGYRVSTKPEHHDVVRAFAKSLKPPIRLSLPALETLAIVAYKQPVTGPEISEIRGVEASGVLATLLERKLITTAGRKEVVGRPILYKTTKEFLLRFGLNDLNELPSMEEFEKMTQGQAQEDLFERPPGPDAAHVPDAEAQTTEG